MFEDFSVDGERFKTKKKNAAFRSIWINVDVAPDAATLLMFPSTLVEQYSAVATSISAGLNLF